MHLYVLLSHEELEVSILREHCPLRVRTPGFKTLHSFRMFADTKADFLSFLVECVNAVPIRQYPYPERKSQKLPESDETICIEIAKQERVWNVQLKVHREWHKVVAEHSVIDRGHGCIIQSIALCSTSLPENLSQKVIHGPSPWVEQSVYTVHPQREFWQITYFCSFLLYWLPMKTYTGGCHCGAVRYEVDMEELTSGITCNCSMCGRAGTILTFVPASQFRLLSGEENLTDYQFNKHVIHHVFCKSCGIKSFSRGVGPDGAETVAVNVRCLDDVDLKALTLHEYDGKHM